LRHAKAGEKNLGFGSLSLARACYISLYVPIKNQIHFSRLSLRIVLSLPFLSLNHLNAMENSSHAEIAADHENKQAIQYKEDHEVDSETNQKNELTYSKSVTGTAGDIVGFEINGDELPPGYFTSKFFLGSMAAICISLWGGVSAFVS
jgi:hypothetical protein